MRNTSKLIFTMAILQILSSCAGYTVKNESNPFGEYNITSIAVPIFLNRTMVVGLSGPITTELKRILHRDTELIVYSGKNEEADAVLVGILESNKNRSEVFQVTGTVFTNGPLADSIGNRNQFYVPNVNQYIVKLKLFLIKSPTVEEVKLLSSTISGAMNLNPKIIFQKSFDLTGSYSRVVRPTENPDSGGIVNFTTNKEIYRRSIQEMALSAATRFQEEILYAF